MNFRTGGFVLAGAVALFGVTRFGHLVLKHPKPPEGLLCFGIAIVIVVATVLIANARAKVPSGR
jgi:uncharacterized membrane protein required for colicin V production